MIRGLSPLFLAGFLLLLCVSSAQGRNLHVEKKCRGQADHVSTVNCLTSEITRLEKELATLLASHEQEARELEKASREAGSVAHQTLQRELADGQKSFSEYVERHCAYEAGLLGTGNGAADVMALCHIRLLRERIDLLAGRLPSYDDGGE